MGSYNGLPSQPPIRFIPSKHEFETCHVQRIKETPFSYSLAYSLQPPIFIDPVGVPLGELVRPRTKTQQLFPPQEVLKLIQNLVSALEQLQQRGFTCHGDINFNTIYYDKRNKLFKLTHPVFSPESGYQLCKRRQRFSLLSPEQLLYLTDQDSNCDDFTSMKSDLFTLAVVVLEVATLLPSSEIYCPDTFVIFDKEIQNRLQLIGEYYRDEPLLCNRIVTILANLLDYDSQNRKDCSLILRQLQQGQEQARLADDPRPLGVVGEVMGLHSSNR